MAYNIIFIDDSESMQRAVATIFINNPDFNLNSISEPSSLFKIAKDFNPDIVILSYNSVNTEIKKNISEIKNGKSLSEVPLLLLVPSDLSDNERELLVKSGVNGFIYRPFEKEVFLSKIKRILGIIDTAPEKTNENETRQGSKIYDISSFEIKEFKTKETDKNSVETATVIPSETFIATAKTEDAKKANEDDSAHYESNNTVNIDSAELSQAFENLFKDDAIFKEFQKLNKRAGADSTSNKPEDEKGLKLEISNKIKIPEENLEKEMNSKISEEPENLYKTESEPELNKDIINLTELNLNKSNKGNIIPENEISTEGGLKLEILNEQNLIKLDELLKNSIQKALEEIKPQVIENIKNMLPEIIERLVKEEVEKIKRMATDN